MFSILQPAPRPLSTCQLLTPPSSAHLAFLLSVSRFCIFCHRTLLCVESWEKFEGVSWVLCGMAPSSSSGPSIEELNAELKDAGDRLLTPISSVDELLQLLDKLECLLSKVAQEPSSSTREALLPIMKALITDEMLRHSEISIQVSVASCLNEITRISAPFQPYNDEQMKDIFELTVTAFDELSHGPGYCYSKAVRILNTITNVRSYLIMLDLDCSVLIVKMFRDFFKTISLDHPDDVFTNMEKIMTLLVEESEGVSPEILKLLLASVKKEHQDISPFPYKLGENVLQNCAEGLKNSLPEAVKSMGLVLDEYAEIVSLICQEASGCEPVNNEILEEKNFPDILASDQIKEHHSNDSGYVLQCENFDATKSEASETDLVSVTKNRDRKPSSLVKPEEGYDHLRINGSGNFLQRLGHVKNNQKTTERTFEISGSMESVMPSEQPGKKADLHVFSPKSSHFGSRSASLPQNDSSTDEISSRKGRPRRKVNITCQDGSPHLLAISDENLLRSQTKGKGAESDFTLKWTSEDTSGIEKRSQKKLRKNLPVPMTEVELTSLEKEKGKASGTEKDLLLLKVGGKAQIEGKTSEKPIAAISEDKIVVSQSEIKSLGENKPSMDISYGTKIKRKWTPKKEKNLIPRVINDYGEKLVGCNIKVWWPLDETFYEGIISSYDPLTSKHKVIYADGDEEILNLSEERWEMLNEVFPNHSSFPEQQANISDPPVSAKSRRKNAKKTPKKALKQEESASATKSPGISARPTRSVKQEQNALSAPSVEESAGKSVIPSPGSGAVTANSVPNSTSSSIDKLKNSTSGVKDEENKSIGKLMSKTLKTFKRTKFKNTKTNGEGEESITSSEKPKSTE